MVLIHFLTHMGWNNIKLTQWLIYCKLGTYKRHCLNILDDTIKKILSPESCDPGRLVLLHFLNPKQQQPTLHSLTLFNSIFWPSFFNKVHSFIQTIEKSVNTMTYIQTVNETIIYWSEIYFPISHCTFSKSKQNNYTTATILIKVICGWPTGHAISKFIDGIMCFFCVTPYFNTTQLL